MPKNKLQQNLFDGVNGDHIDDLQKWKSEWEGMPEYSQEDLTSYKSILVHFKEEKDYKEFQKLIEQKLTYKTQSIWFPKVENTSYIDKIYIVDES
ncbi:MAG TPA: hypothetical protein VIJ57_08300 [Hanamia sp.]